ncbi:MAG: PPOX class F420-dependent oxidoreductase [Chloroflexi bacterium]|nr:PPOX class F420-dependent oxidoreductase [Chloroflexota bacterium]MCH8102887.1 PPOX class F420-dependent oxidoreductase [Chloroflexota bacterium]
MSVTLTENQAALLREKHFAELVTLMPDGSPQITPVWVDTDGTNVLINTAAGRLKTRNIERDPRVAVAVLDPASPYERVLNIRGRVISVSPEGADDHIDSLAKKYMGVDSYPGRDPAEQRVILTIEVDHASGSV